MLGRARTIRSIAVHEGNGPETFTETLNEQLINLGNAQVLSITPYFVRDEGMGYTWSHAIIIYRDGRYSND